MAYPLAAGYRNIGAAGMGYNPTIYSGKLTKKLYKSTVFGEIANTNHEGEIKAFGESVIIRALPDINIRRYSKGQALNVEQPTSTKTTLNIDKGYYWSFGDEAVEHAQTDLKNYVEAWTDVASRQLQIAIDLDVLSNVYADVHASNTGSTAGAVSGNIDIGTDGGTAIQITKDNVIDYIVYCGQVLTEQNVDMDGRWMVVPEWFYTCLLLSDLKAAFLTGDSVSPIRNGKAGVVCNFTIYRSNQVPTSADGAVAQASHVMFGTRQAITFATQLVKNETAPNPFGFGNIYKGLQVYGYSVELPEALGDLYCKKG